MSPYLNYIIFCNLIEEFIMELEDEETSRDGV